MAARARRSSSLKAGEAFVNLSANPGYQHTSWGRVIFRVVDVDGLHGTFMATGLKPESPRDAAGGERFFHIHDPDGHELSFVKTDPNPKPRFGLSGIICMLSPLSGSCRSHDIHHRRQFLRPQHLDCEC